MTVQQRVQRLVKQIGEWVEKETDKESLKEMERYLNDALDLMGADDLFGTEGQNDPRGDHRERL